jgi:hypothetical protein
VLRGPEDREAFGRDRAAEQWIVDKGRAFRTVAKREHGLLAGECGNHRDIPAFQRCNEIVGNVLVAYVVRQDIDALLDNAPRVFQFNDMGHLDLVVLGGLVHHRRGEFRRQLRTASTLGVDPNLDHVGALGDDFVHLGAGVLRRFDLGTRFERLRHEPVHDGQDTRAAQIAGLLCGLELLNVILVEGHAGCRRDAKAGVLTKLRITRGRADVPMTIDDARHDVFSGEVDDGRSCRRSSRGPHVDNAPTLDDDGDTALHCGAAAVDQARIRQRDPLRKGASCQQRGGGHRCDEARTHPCCSIEKGGRTSSRCAAHSSSLRF